MYVTVEGISFLKGTIPLHLSMVTISDHYINTGDISDGDVETPFLGTASVIGVDVVHTCVSLISYKLVHATWQ